MEDERDGIPEAVIVETELTDDGDNLFTLTFREGTFVQRRRSFRTPTRDVLIDLTCLNVHHFFRGNELTVRFGSSPDLTGMGVEQIGHSGTLLCGGQHRDGD